MGTIIHYTLASNPSHRRGKGGGPGIQMIARQLEALAAPGRREAGFAPAAVGRYEDGLMARAVVGS